MPSNRKQFEMMTHDEAVEALIELAKSRIITIDGEWGCCHDYEEALANVHDDELGDGPQPIDCDMHDEAVELSHIIEAVRAV
jgi:hypothetical protein